MVGGEGSVMADDPRVPPIVRDMEALAAKIRDGSVVLEPAEQQLLTKMLDLVQARIRRGPALTTRPRRSR
jgi:hypothetical protein